MKYPDKVTHVIPYGSRRVFRPTPPAKFINGWRVSYHNESRCVRTYGYIELPDGWQDMDRTWTAQDIYWEDKYDCRAVRDWVSQIWILPVSSIRD